MSVHKNARCMNTRIESDRRNASVFGSQGPWLAMGKMGGLIFTDRRKFDRRATASNVQIPDISLLVDSKVFTVPSIAKVGFLPVSFDG